MSIKLTSNTPQARLPKLSFSPIRHASGGTLRCRPFRLTRVARSPARWLAIIVTFSLAVTFSLTSSTAFAQQMPELQLQRQVDNEQTLFNYQFRDLEGQSQRLQFRIPQQALLRTPIVFRPLSQSRLLREMAVAQRAYANQQGWRDARLTIRNGELKYELMQGDLASRNTRLRQWQQAEQEAYAAVLRRNYYQQLRQHSGRQGYTPDHPRIAAESGALLTPLSDALTAILTDTYGNYSPRQALAYVTQFIQQIPYDDFTDRLASPGAGFIAPGRLLYENRGDCDSKVTLLATLMANLFPDIERRIVYLPGHAMFALNIEAAADDIFVRDSELEFVIADPTGPAQLAVGEAARAYQSQLRSGAVTVLGI